MSECPICAHARVHGSWPQELLTRGGTHCSDGATPGCHRSWTSNSQSHCTVCHRHFGSDSAGDKHRFGDYRGGTKPICRDPNGFDRWETPDGVIWGGRNPQEARDRLNQIRTRTPTADYGDGPK